MRTMEGKRQKHERRESEDTIKVRQTDEQEKRDTEEGSDYGTVNTWHTAASSSSHTATKDVFGSENGQDPEEEEEDDGIEWAAVTKEEDELVSSACCYMLYSILMLNTDEKRSRKAGASCSIFV